MEMQKFYKSDKSYILEVQESGKTGCWFQFLWNNSKIIPLKLESLFLIHLYMLRYSYFRNFKNYLFLLIFVDLNIQFTG